MSINQILAANQASESKVLFRPVRCLQSDIDTRPSQEGFLYFTTDTRKIYYGTGTEYKMMGGSSGVIYGTKVLTEAEKDPSIVSLTFTYADIGNKQVSEDDLILNIPDGGFYRITMANDYEIIAQRLAIAGGGNGSGGSDSAGNGSLTIVPLSTRSFTTLLNTPYSIYFSIKALDMSGDFVLNGGTAILYVNSVEKERIDVYNGETYSFAVDQYIKNTQDKYTFTVKVIINAGGSQDLEQRMNWEGRGASLSLEWNYSYSNYLVDAQTSAFTLTWTPYGSTSATTYIMFDNNYAELQEFPIGSAQMGQAITQSFSKLSHGSHTIEMWLKTTVNGVEFETPHQKNEIACVEENNTTAILTVPFYQEETMQYDTINIPYYVYDPKANTTNVQYSINDIKQLATEYAATQGIQHVWPCTLNTVGNSKLKIYLTSGEASKEINVLVKSLDLGDLGEDATSVFELRANTLINDDDLKNWKIGNDLGLEFSENFDWDNGGFQTETIDGQTRAYICVKNGTRMIIKYPLFGNTREDGKEFKIIFKTANCQDYDAEFLNCYNSDNYGLKMTAQNAIFTASNDSLNTQYREDSYLEYELEIWKYSEPTGQNVAADNYVMTWVNGVPNGVIPYTKYDFNLHNQNIIIGSDQCDVHIYLVKLYEQNLNTNNHIRNFIMDAPNSTEIMARYNRNNIMDGTEISWRKLVQQNPKCHVYLYDVPYMPTKKSKEDRDNPSPCSFEEYVGTDSVPSYRAEGVKLKVQGTSSAKYGLGAFNLDSDFKLGLTDGEGNPVDGYQISESSVPVTYTCTKVNVASCENANNAINQEWYNRYQPYHDAHRRENENARDTMEFNMGVIFIKDNNTEITNSNILSNNVFYDTTNYTNGPYYKHYAIGNMGNSKDNTELFHDANNPRCSCVEIPDNGTAYYQMQIVVPENDYTIFDNTDYEFRYPDGNEDADEQRKKDWIAFVRWMADNNPVREYTGDGLNSHTWIDIPTEAEIATWDETQKASYLLEEAEHYEPYTFKGFAPPYLLEDGSYDYNHYSNDSKLKGFTISDYAGDYTYNTVERRMARMLETCEDHLVMDSIIYHYLFIEAHTMIDNVAKNTFWSTEDGIHWDLTRDYDNDTADGIDNNGRLRFNYGIEPYDKTIDETTGEGTYIFNAGNAVWLQMINRLKPVCQEMYVKLMDSEGKGPWDYEKYLDLFTEFQSAIPERVWIADYERKYLRPHRLGDSSFLTKLEGGKKDSQRENYETYQSYYLKTKYSEPTDLEATGSLFFRCNVPSDFDEGSTIDLKYYIDCYSDAYVAKQTAEKIRMKRTDIRKLPVGTLEANTTENIISLSYGDMIQQISNLSSVYPAQAQMQDGIKLNSIILGDEDATYRNIGLNQFQTPKSELLEVINVANVGNANAEAGQKLGELDLTSNINLKELIATGSTFTQFLLCDNGTLETLKLNAVQTLQLDGYKNLTVFDYDEGIYDTLNSVNISNGNDLLMKTKSYDLAKNCRNDENQTFKYQFLGIDWEEPIGVDLDIPVLTKLKAKTPLTNNTITSLSGQITVDNTGVAVNEYDVYALYSKIFPQVVIKYVTEDNLTKAYELKFLTEQNSTIEHYRVLSNGLQTIGTLISGGENSPLITAMTIPNKESTSAYTYTFTGYWIDEEGNKYYNIDELDPAEEPVGNNFADYIPTSDMVFYPEYISAVRQYPVTFRDWDGTLILQDDNESWGVDYNTVYNGPIKNYYYRDSESLPNYYDRYTFKGWSTIPYGDTEISNPVYFDLENTVIENAITLYAHYVIEDCRSVPSNLNYFVASSYNLSGKTCVLSLNEDYANVIAGKISIPSTYMVNDVECDVVSVGTFNSAINGLTRVFILGDKTTSIGSAAFKAYQTNMPSILKGVYWQDNMLTIGAEAFYGQTELAEVTMTDNITTIGYFAFAQCTKFNCQSLPSALEKIDVGAFQFAEALTVSALPATVNYIGSYAFGKATKVEITRIPKNCAINSNAFNNAGLSVKELFIPDTVDLTNADSAFLNFGASDLQVYFQGEVTNSSLGFRSTANIVAPYLDFDKDY